MHKQWFHRLLLSYIPSFLIIIAVLISTLFIAFSELTKKTAVQANEVFAKQVMQSIENSLRSVDQVIMQSIQYDVKLQAFFDAALADDPYASIKEPFSRITELIENTPLVESIYMYRLSDQRIMTPTSLVSLNDFEDREFLQSMLNQQAPFYWTGVRSYTELDRKLTVISFIRKIPLLTGSQGMLIVNVKMDSIAAFINEMVKGDVSFIRLYDRNQQIIYGSDSKLLESAELSEGNSKELTEIQSDYMGWSLTSGITNSTLFQFVSAFSYLWIGFAIITVALGIGWMIYVSRRNYQPIQAIMSRINSYSLQKSYELLGKKQNDEFKFIDSALERLMEQSHHYQKQHEEGLIYRGQQFFMELIEGTRSVSLEDWNKEMQLFELPTQFEYLSVNVIEIDKYAEFVQAYSPKDQSLFKFVLSSLVKEVADNESLVVWFNWTGAKQLTILNQLTGDTEESQSKCIAAFEKIVAWVEENLTFTITVGAGSCVNKLAGIPESYDEALHALKYKSSLGMNKVIGYWELEAKPRGEMFKLLQQVRSIAQSYRLGEESWIPQYRQFFLDLKQEVYTQDEIISLLNYLIYQLHREMMELTPDLQELWN
ncbi:PDC sensor domain-containing protein [Paenibacillus psychroresistens]|nr:cache domain-containing protein [Paenibacillus psychroresistens]